MSEKHTICLMNDSFPPLIDGVANVVVNYARHIEDGLGHAVVATPDHPDKKDSDFDFPVYRYPSIDMRKMTGYLAGVPFSAEVERKLKDEQVDILHTHCPIASCFLARTLREQLDAPVVLTYHTKFDIDIAKVIKSKFLQESSIKALVANINACDEVWVVSKGAGDNLRSLGYKGEYIVMPNGVDLPKGRMPEEQVAEVTAGLDLPENLPLYLFVGRLMWYKGLKISFDALAKLAAEGKDFRMVVVGSGADGDDMKKYIQEQGLSDKVFFAGSVSDRERIRCWYTRANLFLFPSTFDTNGLVVREASACELPSVLIAGSCAAEDVTDGQNAFLIEENADSMADCLRKVGFDFAKLAEIGKNASNELYISWEDAVAHAYERYEVVLERYRSGAYKEHTAPSDDFLNAQGDIMEAIARAEKTREELTEDIIARRTHHMEAVKVRQEEVTRRVEKMKDDTKAFGEKLADDTKAFGEKLADDTKAIGDKLVGDTRALGDRIADSTKAIGDKIAAESQNLGQQIAEGMELLAQDYGLDKNSAETEEDRTGKKS